MHVSLGQNAKDKVTGFQGVVTSYCEYLTGCHQLLLAPKCKEDGTKQDSCWFDIQRVELLGSANIDLDNSETPGCDIPAPIR